MPIFLLRAPFLLLIAAGPLLVLSSTGVSRRCNSRWQEIVVRNKWGYIYSPNFGRGPYYPGDTCYWLLTSADPDQRIRVAFQSFTLQERVDQQCEDYVAIYDGRRETAPSMGTFCGRKSPRVIHSSGRNLLMKFVSNDDLQFPGFRLLYETIPSDAGDPETGATTPDPLGEDAQFAATLSSLKCQENDVVAQDLLQQVVDTKMTASSSWRNHPPWLARLDNKASALAACCWAAENNGDDSSYIQAEFDRRKTVLAIVTQGSDILDEWVTSYRIQFGLNGADFTYYKTYDGKIKLFRANKNAQGKAINILEPPVVAKFIRLIPQTAHRWKTLRWGVFGCNETAPIRSSNSRPRTKTTLMTTSTTEEPENTTPELVHDEVVPMTEQPSAPLIGQIFAEEPPPSHVFSLDTIHDREIATNPEVEERCRGAIRLMTEPRGRITSPNFGLGHNYPSGDSCTWQIFAREDQRIKVVFEILAIEDSFGCQRDFVALYDGPTVGSPPLGKFCGTELPPMLVTSGHQLTIFFNAGDNVEAPGFALTYYFQQDHSSQNYANSMLGVGDDSTVVMPTAQTTAVDNSLRCDDRIVIVHGLNGKIESPGYGRAQYLPDDICNWRIVAPNGRRVRVVFQDFDLAPGTGPGGRCEHEYFSLYDGPTDSSRHLGSFCGSKLPPTVISTGAALFLRFATGAPTGQRAGLRAVFTSIEEAKTEPPTTTTTMAPKTPPPMSNRRPLKFGNEEPDVFRDEGRCEGQIKIMTQPEGAFWSPRYPSQTYYPQDLCYWLIRAPLGFRIRFFFDSLSLESAPRCSIDNLTLYDGDRDSAPLLGYFCGFETPNESFLTSGQYLLVRFASGMSNSMRRTGFRINYRFINASLVLPESPLKLNSYVSNELINEIVGNAGTLPPATTIAPDNIMVPENAIDPILGKQPQTNGCHGVKNLLTGEKGVVVSPNFGNGPYWPSDTCFWEVRTVSSKRIRLGFQVFKVSWSPDCSRDRLIIYDGSSELSRILGTYCGNSLPMPVTSTINVLLLKFVTDSRPKTREDIGFMALYGTLDYVPAETTPTTTESTEPPATTPTQPRLLPISACNGSVAVLTGRSGVITSPSFADNILPAGVMCFWEIRAPSPNKRIKLLFETFAMPATEDCIGAHVALFIGSGSARPQIGRFCGDELPPSTISPGDRLFVRFVSGPFTVPGGFMAQYRIVDPVDRLVINTQTSTTTTPTTTTEEPTTTTTTETTTTTTTTTRPPTTMAVPHAKCNDGRVVLTESKGIINSPNYGNGRRYPRGDSCWWQILLQPGSVIDIRFRSFSLTESRACTGDRLVVIDGPDARRSPKEAFCGHVPPTDFRSSTNIVTLHFYSSQDSNQGDFGFELDYAEAEPDNSGKGTESYSFGGKTEEEVFVEPATTLPPTLPPTTTTTTHPTTPTTEPTTITLRTTTEEEPMIRPEAENVFAVEGPCSGRVFILQSDQRSAILPGWKRIASPNFATRDGSTYAPNDVCFWKVISSDDSNVLELRVELIDMTPSGSGCFKSGHMTAKSTNSIGDILSIFNGPDEGSPLLGFFCGEHRDSGSGGTRLITTANHAFVKFTSGPSPVGYGRKPAGFLIAYRAIPKMNPPVTAVHTTAPTTRQPITTMNPIFEVDTTAPFVLKPQPNVGGNHVKSAESGATMVSSPQLTRCEGRLQIFSQDSGVISSPNYGDRNGYATSDSCLWEIIGRSGAKVQLSFKEFDVGVQPYPKVATDKIERCPSDRVVVFDGPGEYYPIQSVLCGRVDNGFTMVTTSNAAFIQFTSLPISDGGIHAGFVLEYSIITTSPFSEEMKANGVPHPHQVFAEAPTSPIAVPFLSDTVVRPLPPGVVPAGKAVGGTSPAVMPWWWCDDDLVAMLPDQAISASSEQNQHHPKLVRDRRVWTPSPVEMPCCWQPSDHDSNPFVQFDFGGPHMIGAARIIDMRPIRPNVTNSPALYLLVSESFETASDSRIPLTASDTKINIKPPIVASKVRVYMVRQRTVDNKLVMPRDEYDRPLIRISLFGCSAPVVAPAI